ncbi:MAG: pentapeptide repeat-containing protein, partial [Acidobacteria bacterium]|nr:pentapeptide repeat-containing protein [Acidobacteriota bacterium]
MAGNVKVYKKLLRSEPVHFDAKKQTEKEREVPAEWVAKALRAGRRVELKDAILTGPLNLQSAHVEQEFILLGGEVRGPVSAFYARFARWVMFHDVDFHDEVSFKGARFAAELNCAGTHFLKSVTFEDSIIEGSFPSSGAQFGSSEKDPVGFNNCEIRCDATFVLAVFHGPAQFLDLTVGKQANFNGARFEGETAFGGAEIGGNFFFRPQGEQRVEFGGEARFHGVKVGGQADFRGARFKQEVSFQGATVEGEAGFVGVEFQKAASFQRAEFKAGLYFSQPQSSPATFGGEAQFHGVKVGGQANFSGARFDQKVAFEGAEIGGDFFFRPEGKHRVEFGGEARFHGVKVGGQASFREAQFEQRAFFEGAVFVGGSFFREVEFSAPASFVNARFQLAAEFQGAQFQGPADFDYARFEQEVHFAGAKFGGQLKLRDARMTTLSFLEEQEEKKKKVAVFHPGFKVDLL